MVWSMLEEYVSQLDEPFRRSEIIEWFRRHQLLRGWASEGTTGG